MHSLRWYISVGFLMVGVGPLIFFGAQRISALFSTQNASIQQKHEPMAESLAQAIYGYLLDQTAALQSTASQVESDTDAGIPHLNDSTFNATRLNQALAAAHSAQPALLQLYVGNLNGRAVAAAPPAGVGVDYGDWNYVKDVLNPGRVGPKYSDVIRSKGDSSVAAVVIAVPILDAGRHLVGFLAGTVNLSEVQRLSTYSRIGVNGQAVVVDRRGRVIAHPRDDWRLEAKDLSSAAIFQQSLGQETGVSWYTDPDGNIQRAAGFATVPVVGWKVWVSQPVAELRSELTPLIQSTVEWLLVAIVLALVLGFLGAAWITRPVDELNRAASRIAQGDFVTPLKVREQFAAKELRALAHTFNQMAHRLSGAYQTLEEKVSQRTSELQAANQELARANKLKSEFLANVSHELRTPLSAIIGFSQILLDGIDGPVNEDQHQDILQVNKSGQSLLALINQILDLSKIEAGKMELSVERVELPALITSILESISPLAQEKGLRIETRFAPGLPAVEGDAARLKQVLINLLSNAVKFTERGHVEVIAQPSGRMVRITVKDTGIGISAESQRVIFDEFVQGDGSSTRKHGGTGLGLSIVRKLVEMHGGAITVSSEPGRGSIFTFTVPAWATSQGAVTTLQQRPLRRPNHGLPGTAILVVDDDPLLIKSLRDTLESDGHVITTADGGQAGINAFVAAQQGSDPFAVVITDLGMPYVDGRKVATAVKAASSATPVILLTGWGQRLEAEGDAPSNVDRVLSKPPKLRELRVALAELTARTPPTRRP